MLYLLRQSLISDAVSDKSYAAKKWYTIWAAKLFDELLFRISGTLGKNYPCKRFIKLCYIMHSVTSSAGSPRTGNKTTNKMALLQCSNGAVILFRTAFVRQNRKISKVLAWASCVCWDVSMLVAAHSSLCDIALALLCVFWWICILNVSYYLHKGRCSAGLVGFEHLVLQQADIQKRRYLVGYSVIYLCWFGIQKQRDSHWLLMWSVTILMTQNGKQNYTYKYPHWQDQQIFLFVSR